MTDLIGKYLMWSPDPGDLTPGFVEILEVHEESEEGEPVLWKIRDITTDQLGAAYEDELHAVTFRTGV